MNPYVDCDINVWISADNPEMLYPYGVDCTGYYPEGDNLQMSIHQGWLDQMEDLSLGDLVSTYDDKIGIITKITNETGLGFKVFEVLIEGEKLKYFSINLKKIEVKK